MVRAVPLLFLPVPLSIVPLRLSPATLSLLRLSPASPPLPGGDGDYGETGAEQPSVVVAD